MSTALNADLQRRIAPFLRVFSSDSVVQQSNEGRLERARSALEAFRRNPLFGGGFDQLKSGHSVPIQLLATGGIVLFVCFTFYAVMALRQGWRRGARGESDALVIAATLAHGAWLAAGVVSNAISDRYLYVPVAILAVDWSRRHHSPPAAEASTLLASRGSAPATR